MLRSASEYEDAVRRLAEVNERLETHRRELQAQGLKPAEVKRALDPARSFHAQLADEIADYERQLTPPVRRDEDR